MKNRIKNPWFWIGILGIVLTAMGIEPSTLTSWSAVGQAGINLVTNPFMLITVAMAVLGVFVDPSSSGFRDLGKYASDDADPSKVRLDIERRTSEAVEEAKAVSVEATSEDAAEAEVEAKHE